MIHDFILNLFRVVIFIIYLPDFSTGFIASHKGHVPVKENCVEMMALDVEVAVLAKLLQILLDILECLDTVFRVLTIDLERLYYAFDTIELEKFIVGDKEIHFEFLVRVIARIQRAPRSAVFVRRRRVDLISMNDISVAEAFDPLINLEALTRCLLMGLIFTEVLAEQLDLGIHIDYKFCTLVEFAITCDSTAHLLDKLLTDAQS